VKRYYLSEIVQDASGVIAPAAAESGLNYVVLYPPDDPATGLPPIGGRCLVLVSGANHAAALADARNDALPDFPLDAKVSALKTSTRVAARQALQRRGFDVSAIDNADGFRDVIRAVGRQLDAHFDENNFDVAG
jgi:hypothetical protein